MNLNITSNPIISLNDDNGYVDEVDPDLNQELIREGIKLKQDKNKTLLAANFNENYQDSFPQDFFFVEFNDREGLKTGTMKASIDVNYYTKHAKFRRR